MTSDKKYDITYLESISNNDQDFIREMIQSFLVNTPGYFSGMKEAIDNADYQLLYRIVHKFIPTLSFVGANAKMDEFESLEQLAKNEDDPEAILNLYHELNVYCQEVCNGLRQDFDIER